MVKTFKFDLGNGYERVKTYVGKEVTGFNKEGTKEVIFVPDKIIKTYVSCPVTHLHLNSIKDQITLRSYAATAVKAIGLTYDEENTSMQYTYSPMVLIQTKANKWFALWINGYDLQVQELKDFTPYDIDDEGKFANIENLKVWGWRYLTVNQSQSTNKRLMSIVDWFLKR